jgi:hypothetical protein
MNDDVFPSVAADPGVVYRFANSRSEVLPADISGAGSRYQVLFCFGTGFLHDDRVIIISFAEQEPMFLLLGSRNGRLSSN